MIVALRRRRCTDDRFVSAGHAATATIDNRQTRHMPEREMEMEMSSVASSNFGGRNPLALPLCMEMPHFLAIILGVNWVTCVP